MQQDINTAITSVESTLSGLSDDFEEELDEMSDKILQAEAKSIAKEPETKSEKQLQEFIYILRVWKY